MSSDETLTGQTTGQDAASQASEGESPTTAAAQPTEASAQETPATEVSGQEVASAADAENQDTVEGTAAEPTPPDDSATAQDGDESRKVELKPSGGVALRAVGTVPAELPRDGSGEGGDDESAAGVSDVDMQQAADEIARAARDAGAGEVAIPNMADVDLGDLEAEINAAMQTDDATSAVSESDVSQQELPSEGTRLHGIIQSVHGDDVFVDLGVRLPGVLQMRQFEGTDPPEIGNKVQVVVRKVNEDEGLIGVTLPTGKQRLGGNWDAVEKGQIVDCTVSKTNKGGLEVMVGTLRAFLPAGQIDLQYVENLDQYIGQKLTVKITEANSRKRNLVVSRRNLLLEERREKEGEFWESISEGVEFTGRVKTLKDYGAFVDLGGADGFLHIGQIAWTHIKHPNEVLSEGQEIDVKVIKLEKEKKRVGLTMKGLQPNPWDLASEKYSPESVVTGTVTRTMDFGAFVELEPGVEGLVHISELDWKRVRKVTDVVREGQEVSAKVLEFDSNRRRISLSLKALSTDPDQVENERLDKEAEEQATELAKRKPRADLRGGIGSPKSGGGLFGNPTDFGG